MAMTRIKVMMRTKLIILRALLHLHVSFLELYVIDTLRSLRAETCTEDNI